MNREIIRIPGVKTADLPFSHVVKAGDILYLTSQLSCDLRTGLIIPGDVAAQTRKAMENIKYLLSNAGSSMAHVLMVRVYMRNASEFGEMNRVHFFTGPDLLESFRDFEVLETGIMDDPEDHGEEGPHIHRLRYIAAIRKSAFEFDGDRYKAASKHQKEWGCS